MYTIFLRCGRRITIVHRITYCRFSQSCKKRNVIILHARKRLRAVNYLSHTITLSNKPGSPTMLFKTLATMSVFDYFCTGVRSVGTVFAHIEWIHQKIVDNTSSVNSTTTRDTWTTIIKEGLFTDFFSDAFYVNGLRLFYVPP